MHKLTTAVAVCFFGFILWVIYLANTGSKSIFFDFIKLIPYGDKLGHVCLFGFLTMTVVAGSRFRSFSIGNLRLYYGAVLVILFVVGEEISQIFIPSRTFDLIDLSADMFGILLAVCVSYIVNKHLTRRSSKDAVNGAS